MEGEGGPGCLDDDRRRFPLCPALLLAAAATASPPPASAKEAAVDFVTTLAPLHRIAYCVVRPTAYFKDFTEYPWRAMQVLQGEGNLV